MDRSNTDFTDRISHPWVSTVASLVALFCWTAGCEKDSESISQNVPTTALEFSIAGGKLQTIPPQGASVACQIINHLEHNVQVAGIRKSCGCVDVFFPDTLTPGTTLGEIIIRGEHKPNFKSISVEVQTDAGAYAATCRYVTGDIPQASPKSIKLADWGRKRSGRTTIWVTGKRQERLHLLSPGFHWVGGSGYTVLDPQTVLLDDDGVAMLTLEFTTLPEASIDGAMNLLYEHGTSRQAIPLLVISPQSETESLRLVPSRIEFTDVSRNSRKCFVVSASTDFSLDVITTELKGCQVAPRRLSPRCWQVFVEGPDPNEVRSAEEFSLDFHATFNSGETDELTGWIQFRKFR